MEKTIIKDELKERLAFLISKEAVLAHNLNIAIRDEGTDAALEKVCEVLTVVMEKGKLRREHLTVLHERGVYILGLLSDITKTTPKAANKIISRSKYLSVYAEHIERAIINSVWFYGY